MNGRSEEMKITDPKETGQTIIINQQERQSNGIGIAGFVLALIALFLGLGSYSGMDYLGIRIDFLLYWGV